MTIKSTALAATLLLSATPILAAADSRGAAELERALKGRVAGEPVDCLQLHEIRSTRIIPNTGIIYETNGGTLYLNRPSTGQTFLDKWDVLVTDTRLSAQRQLA